MLGGMSDPQQPQVPPYASGAQWSTPPGYPTTGQPAQSAPPPGYPAAAQAPQAVPGYTGAYSAAPVAPSGSTDALGRVGFIIGLAGLAISMLFSLITQIMYSVGGYPDFTVIGAISSISQVLVFLCAAAALVLGILGLRRGGSKTLAGIATGLGIAGVATGLFSFMLGGISTLLGAF